MGCWQCLPLSVVQLKGKHRRKPHCHNGVVDTFGQWWVCYIATICFQGSFCYIDYLFQIKLHFHSTSRKHFVTKIQIPWRGSKTSIKQNFSVNRAPTHSNSWKWGKDLQKNPLKYHRTRFCLNAPLFSGGGEGDITVTWCCSPKLFTAKILPSFLSDVNSEFESS